MRSQPQESVGQKCLPLVFSHLEFDVGIRRRAPNVLVARVSDMHALHVQVAALSAPPVFIMLFSAFIVHIVLPVILAFNFVPGTTLE